MAAISPWEVSSERRHRTNFNHSIEINVGGKIGSEDFRVFQQNRPKAAISKNHQFNHCAKMQELGEAKPITAIVITSNAGVTKDLCESRRRVMRYLTSPQPRSAPVVDFKPLGEDACHGARKGGGS